MISKTIQTNLCLSVKHRQALRDLKKVTGIPQTTLVEIGIESLCKKFGVAIDTKTIAIRM